MQRPYRLHHLLHILTSYDQSNEPIDRFLQHYFREHKALGSKDRRFIGDALYTLLRWRLLIDQVSGASSWEARVDALSSFDPDVYQNDTSIPAHIRLSYPKELYARILNALGEKEGKAFCYASNHPAPLTIRINPAKTTREELLQKWNLIYKTTPCATSQLGIIFPKRVNFHNFPEYKKGYFEVQDEGSQCLASLIQSEPEENILDYCAGSGGKTLAFAHRSKGKGTLYLHDIRKNVLKEAVKRLKRAGIKNFSTFSRKAPQLQGMMDWILVDAPCSGLGTLRRNPDLKWHFTESFLNKKVLQQREVFTEALRFLKPGGKIVYATCSILPEENEKQTHYFLEKFPLEVVGEPFHSIPEIGGMDGFYGVVFKKH